MKPAPKKRIHHRGAEARSIKLPNDLCWAMVIPVMRQILETEEYVKVPPAVYSDPFYRITYLIKEEIRKHKWLEGEKGRKLSWEQARQEWMDAHREAFEKFLLDALTIPETIPQEEPHAEERHVFVAGQVLKPLLLRPGG